MTFEVKDYDLVGKNDLLGTVVVPPEKILEATGDRLEFNLTKHEKEHGHIAIRCRPATTYDREFLNHAAGDKKKDFMGLAASNLRAMNPAGGAGSAIKSLMQKRVKEGKWLNLVLFPV